MTLPSDAADVVWVPGGFVPAYTSPVLSELAAAQTTDPLQRIYDQFSAWAGYTANNLDAATAAMHAAPNDNPVYDVGQAAISAVGGQGVVDTAASGLAGAASGIQTTSAVFAWLAQNWLWLAAAGAGLLILSKVRP